MTRWIDGTAIRIATAAEIKVPLFRDRGESRLAIAMTDTAAVMHRNGTIGIMYLTNTVAPRPRRR
jgi:hypothetical protein